MSSHTVIVIDPKTGALVMGEVFNQRTPQDAFRFFCTDKQIDAEKAPDAIVLLGMTGSKMLHKSAQISRDHRSYTQVELQEAFNLVRNEENWKKPVNKVLIAPDEELLKRIGAAVPHFTGGSVEFRRMRGNKVRVTASGYYANIGA